MREYKFRGKSLLNNAWIVGYLIIDDISDKYYILPNGNSCNESDKIGEEGLLHILTFEVDKETVGQSTGLKDRNMKEIYEGDIVKRSLRDKEDDRIFFEDFYVIIFEKAAFQYKGIREYYISETGKKLGKKEKEIYRQNLGSNFGVNIKDIEVIGNIYETPELLKEGE